MRDYGKVSPKFWIGDTGKQLRRHGMEAQLLALYLLTNPHANMLGLYYLPITLMAHETGLGMEGASKGLRWCCEAGFCHYDERSEVVWVPEMALYQIGAQLSPGDKRCIGVQNEYASLPGNPFLGPFFDKYQADFHMTARRESASPIQAPSKPPRSQEQEQEQEKEQEQDCSAGLAIALPAVPTKKPARAKAATPTAPTWAAYSEAYQRRYKAEPVRNATTNAQMASFIKRIGEAEAPEVAAFFVWHNGKFYVQQMHGVGAMLRDAEKLRTEWATGIRMTETRARQADRTQNNGEVFARLIAEAEAHHGARPS